MKHKVLCEFEGTLDGHEMDGQLVLDFTPTRNDHRPLREMLADTLYIEAMTHDITDVLARRYPDQDVVITSIRFVPTADC
jgi:hypothetical protein